MSGETYLLAAAVAGVGSEAAGITDVTPIGRGGGDDDSSSGGGVGSEIITVPGEGVGLEGLGEVFDSVNRPQSGGGLGELAEVFSEVSSQGTDLAGKTPLAGRIEDYTSRFEDRLEEQRERFEDRREEWETELDNTTDTDGSGPGIDSITELFDTEDSGGNEPSPTDSGSGGGSETPGFFEGVTGFKPPDPSGYADDQADGIGDVFGKPGTDAEGGLFGGVYDAGQATGAGAQAIWDATEGARDAVTSDTGKVEDVGEKFRKANDPQGDTFFGDELTVEAEGTPVTPSDESGGTSSPSSDDEDDEPPSIKWNDEADEVVV